jgi:HlyD family secretion protein
MKTIKWLGIIVLVAGVAFVGWRLLSGAGPTNDVAQAAAPPTVQVIRGNIEQLVGATGYVASGEQVSLTFGASGRIEEVLVDVGDRVAQDAILAQIDSSSIDEQIARLEASLITSEARLAQTKLPPTIAEVASAEASVASAQAAIASAESAVENAQAQMDALLAGASERDIRSAELQVEAAKNQLWAAQAQRDATAGNPMSSQAQIDAANASVQSAEVSVQQTLLSLERLSEPPSSADVIRAQTTIDQAESQRMQAQSQLAQAESQLAQLTARPRAEDVAIAEAQLAETRLSLEQARASLEDSTLSAPLNATVISLNAVEGEMASPGTPAFVLADMDHLVLDVKVDELDIADIAVGQLARLEFESLPGQEIIGEVTHIAPSATATGGAVAYRVEISFTPGDLPVRLGMTTNVDIATARSENALLVPNSAITSDREANVYYVTVQNGLGATREVKVEVGLRDEDYTEILSGVDEGDTLVLAQVPVAQNPLMNGPMFGAMQERAGGDQ